MLEKKVFESSFGDILSDEDIWRIFSGLIFSDKVDTGYNPHIFTQLFVHAGSVFTPVSFDFDVNEASNQYDTIRELDEIKFVSDAIKIAKEYRVIDDQVYRNVNRPIYNSDKGSYIIAINGQPFFNITIEGDRCYKTMIFQNYGKKEFFKHKPILEVHPNQIEIEVSATNQKEQKIFVDMYNKILNYYKGAHSKVIEPEPINK
jgi:hypothetical protein